MAQPLVIIEEHECDISALLPFIRHQNVTNDRLVALSFRLRGASLTRVHVSFAQRSDLPFSGLVKPRLDVELASWIPVKNTVFFETAEKFNHRQDPAGFAMLHDTLKEIRTRDRKPAAELQLASRFMKLHSQYAFSPGFGMTALYEPGSSGVTSIRAFERSDRLIGVKVNSKGQAEQIVWAPLNKSLKDIRSLSLSRPWSELLSLSGTDLAPYFSRQFGKRDTTPEMILNVGADLRIHLRFTSKAFTATVAQFNLPWRVIGPPPVPNPTTCLIYQVSGNGLEIENADVTGNSPLAANLACTVR